MLRKTRILLVDDHPVVRQGLAALLDGEPDIEVVGEAGSAAEAVQKCKSLDPDLVLLDLRLGSGSGVGVIEAIHATRESIKFVVFTTFDDDEDIFRAVEAGARGYLLKDTFGDEILQTVRDVARGLKRIPPVILARLAQRKQSVPLTAREREVLPLIVRGLSNKEIAAVLGVGEGTIKTHVVHILEKLDVDDRTAAATQALRRGLVRDE